MHNAQLKVLNREIGDEQQHANARDAGSANYGRWTTKRSRTQSGSENETGERQEVAIK